MKIVLANGCFDLLHPGHVKHLTEARSMGDFLFVALTKDEFVEKGVGRPIIPFEGRCEMLRALKCVTAVVGSENSVEAIRYCRPSIFVKGIDYASIGLLPEEERACKEVGAEIRFTKSEKQSTTDWIHRIERLQHERRDALTMYYKIKESLPPKDEVLAVIHKFGRGGNVDDEAVWNGENWKSRRSGEIFEKNYFNLWRRLET